jgi:Xaa-Pro aminopeptidase
MPSKTPQPPDITRARNMPGRWTTDTGPNIDVARLCAYRLERVRQQLRKHDCAACVLYDSINTRYATGSRNNAVFNFHYMGRYCFVPVEGPVVLFESPYKIDLPRAEADAVDEVRPVRLWRYAVAGLHVEENVKLWADEIADLIRAHGGGNRRLAIDRCEPLAAAELARHGIELFDGQTVLEFARAIKSDDELACMSLALGVADVGMARMREALEPGMTENELWAILHHTNIAMGGEWIDTRLLASGGRTNPWCQECNDRMILAGELVGLDTDLIGPFGYCADVSRTFHCGPGKPTAEQCELYSLAYEEVAHNMALLRAGLTIREFAEKALKVPERFVANSYPYLAHGVGLCDEWPYLVKVADLDNWGEDLVLEAGMTICVESYVGAEGGDEGVKLEQQVLITDDGVELLSTFPFEEALLE